MLAATGAIDRRHEIRALDLDAIDLLSEVEVRESALLGAIALADDDLSPGILRSASTPGTAVDIATTGEVALVAQAPRQLVVVSEDASIEVVPPKPPVQ